MNPAFQKEDALLADIASVTPDGHFRLWWLGQSGFLVQWNGRHLLFDPYLSDSLTRKYADTDKPHVRLTERVASPGALTNIDVVTSSHNHTDHLDAETLLALANTNPALTLVLPAANEDFARERLGTGTPKLLGLDDGTSATVAGFEFHGIPAAHNAIDRDESGRCRYLGLIVKFGPWTVYHSGDTLWHDHLVAALLPHAPDLMLLPINGNKPARRVAGNLNGTEAAALARACNARMVIPCHYDMFAFNTASPQEFTTAAEKLSQPHHVLRNGESWCSSSL
jgi:L-ascorbate metabolism protein UlaG (beta-lactamase superfamily)